ETVRRSHRKGASWATGSCGVNNRIIPCREAPFADPTNLNSSPPDPYSVDPGYTAKEAFRPLIPGEPLRHHQQAARVEGTAGLRGASVTITGEGVRDRTWGYRDESAQLVEYVAVTGVFDSFYLSAMKFLGPDGTTVVDGFVTDGPEPARVTAMRVTRDAAGLFLQTVITLADGSERTVRNRERRGGFWVPMGVDREGPTMSAYDEFLTYDPDGRQGNGVVEQGILRRLF